MAVMNFAERAYPQGSDEVVEISDLSRESGFPAEFIKEELLLTGDSIKISELRNLMLNYLQTNFG